MENYEVLGVLGKGSFGTVSKIRRKADGKVMVWKELSYGHMSEREKQLVVTEVNVLRELRHPFIVRYFDRIIDKHAAKLYIVMELCEGGDLGQLIRRCRRTGTYIEESRIWRIFSQLLLALKECHRHQEGGAVKPIIHRDIKPGNVMVDAAMDVKLGDFGLSKELASRSKFAYTNVGTPFYMSPEMINELRYNERTDIWALGCLLYELAALRPPFEAANQLALAMKINSGKFAALPPQYSEDLYRVIRWMLHVQQSKRPQVEELERMPQLEPYIPEGVARVLSFQGKPRSDHRREGRSRERDPREEELRRREARVAEKERQLAALEAEIARRLADVEARERQLEAASDIRRRVRDPSPRERVLAPVKESENLPPVPAGIGAAGTVDTAMGAAGPGDGLAYAGADCGMERYAGMAAAAGGDRVDADAALLNPLRRWRVDA